MSLSNSTIINCPSCNAEQKIDYFSSVNVTVDPSLKEKVLSAKINYQTCTHCKSEINPMSEFLYHDMEKKILLFLKIDENSREDVSFDDFLEKGYIIRIVTNYPKLVEKIKLFDNNLNDKIIEKIENEIQGTFKEVIKDNTLHVFFEKIEKGLFKKKIVFQCFTHPSQLMQIKWDFKQLSKEDNKDLFNLEILRN